jgi:hypothetical protein
VALPAANITIRHTTGAVMRPTPLPLPSFDALPLSVLYRMGLYLVLRLPKRIWTCRKQLSALIKTVLEIAKV